MKHTPVAVSQVRVRGFASEVLGHWSERTGLSEAHIAESIISAAFHAIIGNAELRRTRAWLDKSAEAWAAAQKVEARRAASQAELDELTAYMAKLKL